MENLFRKEVTENRINRLEGSLTLIQPASYKVFLRLVIFVCLMAIVVAYNFSISKKVTVVGRVESSTGVIKVKTSNKGSVSEILVNEGDIVKSGQPLLKLTSSKYGRNSELSEIKLLAVKKELKYQLEENVELTNLYSFESKSLTFRKNNLEKQLIELNTQKKIYQKRLELNKKIVNQLERLNKEKYVSTLDYNRQMDSLLHLEQQISDINTKAFTVKSEITNTELLYDKLKSQYNLKTVKVEKEINKLETLLLESNNEKNLLIKAPIAGRISNLLVKDGDYLTNNKSIVNIIPEPINLQASFYVPTESSGFLSQGQKAILKYPAFPYEKFGVHKGKIIFKSETVTFPEEAPIKSLMAKPAYKVIVTIDEPYIYHDANKIPLKVGMPVESDLIVDERSILEWILSPLIGAYQKSK